MYENKDSHIIFQRPWVAAENNMGFHAHSSQRGGEGFAGIYPFKLGADGTLEVTHLLCADGDLSGFGGAEGPA